MDCEFDGSKGFIGMISRFSHMVGIGTERGCYGDWSAFDFECILLRCVALVLLDQKVSSDDCSILKSSEHDKQLNFSQRNNCAMERLKFNLK